MTPARILVAGIGNIFLGDDAFGVEVAQRLARKPLPDGVCVVDFGIRGLDLAYALLDPYEMVILVDAAPRGGPPGTLYVLEVAPRDVCGPDAASPAIDMHGMDPVQVLRMTAALGRPAVGRILLVGCEPKRDDNHEMSDPVRVAVDEAVLLVHSVVDRLLRGEDAVDRGAFSVP
ncbi:MAG: hydrogenase maturation protease [Gemmataceae bacterium]|nr:hydrogenase maturation protease [Gemmataceae bacterium]